MEKISYHIPVIVGTAIYFLHDHRKNVTKSIFKVQYSNVVITRSADDMPRTEKVKCVQIQTASPNDSINAKCLIGSVCYSCNYDLNSNFPPKLKCLFLKD